MADVPPTAAQDVQPVASTAPLTYRADMPADLAAKRTDLKSRLLDEQSALAGANADYATSSMQAEAEKPLARSRAAQTMESSPPLIASSSRSCLVNSFSAKI